MRTRRGGDAGACLAVGREGGGGRGEGSDAWPPRRLRLGGGRPTSARSIRLYFVQARAAAAWSRNPDDEADRGERV